MIKGDIYHIFKIIKNNKKDKNPLEEILTKILFCFPSVQYKSKDTVRFLFFYLYLFVIITLLI
ncbi:hypothetical protein MHHB_P0672 [Methanofervidicoccus abyssi]|uniref:Uncharacterized protein n=1 Tax=Methanofervidicoccus abyssi TaxID=2082189 RepID=A0A401HQH2_9EURY|nr:hypothetical protein MHHB_P0672 [Methanofervidicoccus abyssi]